MAKYINRQHYQAMISALYTGSARINNISSNLQTIASIASSALGQEDTSVEGLYKEIRKATIKYADLSDSIRNLASSMETELASAEEEHAIWNEDN